MARAARLFAPGLLCHVIVRGNHKQRTFLKDGDYQAYFERLAKYCRRYKVRLYAYCLMPNHVHLLLESSQTPLAKFMQGLQQSYTQYFNRSYRKVGHLFQGRYKAIICQRDEYLLELVRYIHLNPVRSKLARTPEEYRYSGHSVYLQGKATEGMDPGPVLKLLGGKQAYRRFVQDGLDAGHREEYYDVEDQRFLGAGGFGERLREEVEGSKEEGRKKPSLAEAIEELARKLKVSAGRLRAPDRSRRLSRIRTLVAYVLVRYGGYKVREVAEYLGRDATTISSLLSRLTEKMQEETELSKEAERLCQIV